MPETDLQRQVREAEALVRQLERGEKATPKQNHSVTLRNSHGGYAGKSLIEKIRDDLAETIGERENMNNLEVGENGDVAQAEAEYLDGLIDGMCHALSILRVGIGPDHSGEVERRWAEAAYRENKRHDEKREREASPEIPTVST